MIKGVEIDFVVKNSLETIELYERIFEVERLEVTEFPIGQNEAVFNIYGTRFHILDENPEYGLLAPKEGDARSLWFNVAVPNLIKVHDDAILNGCIEMQAPTEVMDFGVINSIFVDPFGYMWMLHEIREEVSFEDRVAYFEEQKR